MTKTSIIEKAESKNPDIIQLLAWSMVISMSWLCFDDQLADLFPAISPVARMGFWTIVAMVFFVTVSTRVLCWNLGLIFRGK